MKREYLVRGILATIFAILLLMGLFFGIRFFLKDSCNKGEFDNLKINSDCFKVNPSCKENTIEIINNCDNSYFVNDYSFELNQENVEYSDLSGSMKNLIVILSKSNSLCDYGKISLINPSKEEEIIEMKCSNLFIPENHKTIIQTGKSFLIKSNELEISGSWK